MKSLNHYTDAAMTKALNDNGAFYAFSDTQFNEQKQPNIVYQRDSSGLIVPKENVNALIAQMRSAVNTGIAARLAEFPIDDIIAYELGNYECYYSGDIDDAVNALKPYNVTHDDVLRVYNATKNDQN
jgi:hypothetical protein